MSFQAVASKETMDDNDFGEDFDDDDSFLNLDDEGVLPSNAVLIPPAEKPGVVTPDNLKKGEDAHEENQVFGEGDDMGMDADDEIFLQVEEGLNYVKEKEIEKESSKIFGTPDQVQPPKTVKSSQTPTSNFNVTPPDFDDSDDDLWSNIDLDITSISSQENPGKFIELPVQPATLKKTAITPIRATSISSTSSTSVATVANKVFTHSTNTDRESTTSFCELTPKVSTIDRPKLRARKSTPSRKTPASRRFPGPAGLLPHLKPVEFNCLDSPKSSNSVSRKIHDIIASHQNLVPACPILFSSQEEKSVFERRTWVELMFQLKLNPKDTESPLSLMNIEWIRTKATRLPSYRKIPFLVVVVHEAPELISGKMGRLKAPCVTLMDPTGSIDAAVDANFLSVYGNYLKPGTALALKNVGLLQVSKRHLILTITEQNVICMTSTHEKDDQDQNKIKGIPIPTRDIRSKARRVFLTDDDIRVTEFCDFNPEKAVECYYQMNLPLDEENEEDDQAQELAAAPVRPKSLFDTTRVSGPSFTAPRSTTGFGTVSNSENAFISNRTVIITKVNPTTTVESESVFSDDDDAFFQALEEIGFNSGADEF